MSNPIIQMLNLGAGHDEGPRVSPLLRKKLMQHHLRPNDIVEHVKKYRADAFVIGLKTLADGQITAGKKYAIDDICFSENGDHIVVTVSDDMQLRTSCEVLVKGSADEIDTETYSEKKLALPLDSLRQLLADKWGEELTKSTNHLLDSYRQYKDRPALDVGDIVCFKDNLMIAGAMMRRGTAVVVQHLGFLEHHDPRSFERTDILIGFFDAEGDFAIIPINSGRLMKVPLDQVGTYKNPYAVKAASPDDEPAELSTVAES